MARKTIAELQVEIMEKDAEIGLLRTRIRVLEEQLDHLKKETETVKFKFGDYAKTVKICIEAFTDEGFTRDEALILTRYAVENALEINRAKCEQNRTQDKFE